VAKCGKHGCAWAGAAAGLAGGLAGSLAMGWAHAALAKAVGAETHGGPQDSTVLAAEALVGPLSPAGKKIAAPVVHFAFGALMGAAYGAAAAKARPVAAAGGLAFGAALYAGAHAVALPKLRLAESPLDRPLAAEAVEFAAHLVYGAVAEGVRRAVAATLSWE